MVSRITAQVHQAGVFQPEERRIVFTRSSPLIDRCQSESFLMLGQLPWNLSENAPHAAGIAIGELADIITVQLQDATLDQIHLAKIALLDIIGNRLRHTAHQQIFAPQPHRSFVQRIGQRDQTLERFANRFSKQLLPHGPAELLKIERPHVHFPFLGGDDDIRHIPLDGDQRPS